MTLTTHHPKPTKVKDLDEKLAASVDKSVEEALLLVSKEAALKEVESQLAVAEERSKRFEQEASRYDSDSSNDTVHLGCVCCSFCRKRL